jgi:hypothetical protein
LEKNTMQDLIKTHFILNIKITNINQNIIDRFEKINKIISVENNKKPKLSKDIQVPDINQFLALLDEIRTAIDTIKHTYYPRDQKSLKYGPAFPKRTDFDNAKSIIYSLKDDYCKVYKKIHSGKKTGGNPLNKIVEVDLALAKLLNLDKLGFPCTQTKCYTTRLLITSLLSQYVEVNKLEKRTVEVKYKDGTVKKETTYKADDAIRKVFSMYFIGTTKKGEPFKVDPNYMSITNVQHPLSLMLKTSDHEKREEIYKLYEAIIAVSKDIKAIKDEYKKKLQAKTKNEEQLQNVIAMKDKTLIDYFTKEINIIDTEINLLVQRYNINLKKLYF